MRIFPIYESFKLSNLHQAEKDIRCRYLCFSLSDVDCVITFYNSQPLNMRVFTDRKDYEKFIKTIKSSFKKYDEIKEEHKYCVYPHPQEELVPF